MTLRRNLAALVATPLLAAGMLISQPAATVNTAQATTSNTRTVYNYFVKKGLTPAQAAGITGNFLLESGNNPRARQVGGLGVGLGQWSIGGRWSADYHDNVVWYARATGRSKWSLQTQLDFTWYELTHNSSYGLKKLRATKTPAAATAIFMTYFERCGACARSSRVRYANSVLASYGG